MAYPTPHGATPYGSTTASWQENLDAGRIVAGAAMIALHAAALMLLLMPTALPPIAAPPRDLQVVMIPVPKPVDPPPVPAATTPPTPQPDPVPVVLNPARIEPPVAPVLTAEPGDLPAMPADPVFDPGPAPVPSLTPLAGAKLAYASAPPPPYPPHAVRDGRSGTVLLEVRVDVDGKPLEVIVSRSSGHRDLDQAARRQVLSRWRFQPAMLDGRAVQAIGLVPVEFNLMR
jgi:protein TonB